MTTLKLLRRGALVLFVWLGLQGAAAAQPYAPTASAVSNGSYTVTYDPGCESFLPWGAYCEFVYLLEKVEPNGQWTIVSSGTGSISFASRPAGSYSYMLWAGAYDAYSGFYQEGYSPVTTVTVTAAASTPVRDNILTQLDYRYEVRRGDFNYDNRTDFFVRRVAGGTPRNGTVEELVLRQDSVVNGNFWPVVPSPDQAAIASNWALAPSVQTRLHDIDVDGYVDLALSNMGSIVPWARDMIVYSPGAPGAVQPGGTKVVDARFASLVGDTMDYFYDPDYFAKNAPLYYIEVWSWYTWCPYIGMGGIDDYFYSYWPSITYCYIDYSYYAGIYADYSAFSPDAVAIWSYEDMGENGQMTKEQAVASIVAVIESIIQAPLGGWPMEELLGQAGPQTIEVLRRAIEAYQSILSAARAIPEHVDMDNLPPQTPRAREVVHVTGHHLMFNRGHLALEYAPSFAGGNVIHPETLSGEAERWPPSFCWPGSTPPECSYGKLLAKTNKISDRWYLNFSVGTVLPFFGSPGSYWNNQLVPRHNSYANLPYSSKLNYGVLPELGAGLYNSNGYVRGLNGNGGYFVVPADMDSVYPGWDRPVPDEKFR